MTDSIRNSLRDFLQIQPADKIKISLDEDVDRLSNCVKNRVWYNGKSTQLTKLYSQLDVPKTMFWKASMTHGMEMRKTHSGVPGVIVDMIAYIILSDYNGVNVSSKNSTEYQLTWERLDEGNHFKDVLERAVKDVCIVGDGAFKVSYDESLSTDVILEWYPAERVEFNYRRGRIREVVFHTTYYHNRQRYDFCEIYGYGYIHYTLFRDEHEVPVDTIPQTEWALKSDVKFDKELMWAVPVLLGKSEAYEGRGKSLYDGKEDSFDALDEAWSQWMDALRASRTTKYIPESLIPRDANNGKLLTPNPFDNRFIETSEVMSENGDNRIRVESPVIQHESYMTTYSSALDNALQGLISPSTLGIDTKKLDNAEAQREKEKTTLYTRQRIVDLLESVVPRLVYTAVNAQRLMDGIKIADDFESKVLFGEYANPSFESQVETVAKARTSGIMSIEASLDELYGDSKDDAWKTKEARLIKEQSGIVQLDEPFEGDDI